MLRKEFDRQVENLLQKGYPAAAGISVEEFLKHLVPLQQWVEEAIIPEAEIDIENGYLPFLIVVKSDLIETEKAMSFVEREGKQGYIKLYPREPSDFKPIDSVRVPSSQVYLIVDIDRGQETINLTPEDALQTIQKKNRSPLTIDEGVAIMTHYPEFLIKNNCFSLLASRYRDDKRVPAIWITHQREARLGWCWEGNPHTWLGSASCKSRVGS